MKIVNKNNNENAVQFEAILNGDCFKYLNDYGWGRYMKIDAPSNSCNAVNLETGNVCTFCDDTLVFALPQAGFVDDILKL